MSVAVLTTRRVVPCCLNVSAAVLISAEQAGVRIGDIIVQIDSVTVNPTVDVRNLLVNNNPEVSLTFLRSFP